MHPSSLVIRRFGSPARLAAALARHLEGVVAERRRVVLGLPTGRTPLPLYQRLRERCRQGRLDLSQVTTFNLDEFVGIRSSDPASYRSFMQRELFAHVNIPPGRAHFLNGAARDLVSECRQYERRIARAGGLDLVLLGLGVNGHIGFNEPARELTASTHVTRLSAATRRSNAPLFTPTRRRVPTLGVSMGMGTILRARRIVLIATGEAKAAAVRGLVQGPVTPRLPASFLQLHRDAEVWVDLPAAAGLSAP